MNSQDNLPDGRPQKRFRIGTKSCAECRRRKVRCDYPSNSQICTGCSLHGVECVPQQAKTSGGRTHVAQGNDSHARLADLEKMVRQLCQAVQVDTGSSFSDIMDAAKTLKTLRASSSATEDALSPDRFSELSQDSPATYPEDSGTFENAPLLGLFKEAMDLQQQNNSKESITKSLDDPCVKSCLRKLNKCLPTARDLSLILDKTGYFLNVCYAIPRNTPTKDNDKSQEAAFRERFVVNSLKSNDRVGLARGVLCVTLSVQQLPKDFYSKMVHLASSQKSLVDEYLSCAEDLLASIENVSPTMDSLICLILLAKIYTDIGKPRKSWLGYRRALNLGILLGVHRSTDRYEVTIWGQIWQIERQLGLNLGFPCGISDSQLRLSPESSPDERLQHQMGIIAGRIIDRNQDPNSNYFITQLIDEELQRCKSEMPQEWWEAPTDMLPLGTLFYVQAIKLTYFNYIKLLHLPYMLKTNDGSNTSKLKTLEASRNLIKCYLTLRKGREIIACDIMDFQAFSSAVVIIINLLSGGDQEKLQDLELVVEISNNFRYISEGMECSVACQAANVLEYLLKAYEGKYQDPNGFEATIPYFGRVKINFLKKPTKSLEPVVYYGGEPYWNAIEFNANPFLTTDELHMEDLSNQELGIDWTSFNWDGNYEWSQCFETRGIL